MDSVIVQATLAFLLKVFGGGLWLSIWIAWLAVVNTAALLFLRETAGRIVAIVWVCNLVTMISMSHLHGYTRLLGISHAIWWVPMLTLLWKQFRATAVAYPFRSWFYALLATNALSLVIDFIDIIRYIAGERGVL